MSVIALPAAIQIHQLTWGSRNYDLSFINSDSGARQSRTLAPARWTATMTLNLSVGSAQMAVWKSMIMQLRGMANQLALYDVKNPVPRGTARGTMVLNNSTGALAMGGTSLIISGATANGTLLQGDWIGVGSGQTRQLFMVAADAAADGAGNITVTVEPPSRYAQPAGTAVTWNQPTCLMKRADNDASWTALAAAEGSVTLNLLESWE